ncbi:type III-A CRISPR-associated RAMP protein Csm4 [Desulfoscipio gibsoniae]
MGYSLYRLEFTTPVHIGSDSGGSTLDNTQMAIHADTIFSALCCEAVKQGSIAQLAAYFAQGTLTLSDALPYRGEELYLPKPILFVADKKREGDAGFKKKLKSLEYISLSFFKEYLHALGTATVLDPDKLSCSFGQMATRVRVAIKGQAPPLPYYVTAWKFAPNCGLYIILHAERAEAVELFEELLANLAWVGIGGKQSSGWGKFQVEKCNVPDALQVLLTDDQAEYQMLLGTGLPVDAELDNTLREGWYTLVRRGGFVRSEKYADRPLKKRTIYMLAPGSCLRGRFQGGMLDLSEHGGHPVWRTANTLFVGVNL